MNSLCDQQYGLVMTFGYRLGQIMHFISSTICIALSIFIVIYVRKRLYIHPNLKLIFCLQFTFAVAHSIIESVFQIHHLVVWYTATTSCDALFPISFCIYFIAPFLGSQYGMVISMLFGAIDLLVGTFRAKFYEDYKGYFGMFLALLTVLATTLLTIYVFWDVQFSEYKASCGMTPQSVSSTASDVLWLLVAIDILTLFLFYFTFRLNSRNVKRGSIVDYDLGSQYHGRDNIKMTRLIYPCVIAHQLLFAFYFIVRYLITLMKPFIDSLGVYAFRLVSLYFYVIPYYTALMPLIFVWNMRRLSKKNRVVQIPNQTDLYFEQLCQQWEKKE